LDHAHTCSPQVRDHAAEVALSQKNFPTKSI
jgi:hypothetical protein